MTFRPINERGRGGTDYHAGRILIPRRLATSQIKRKRLRGSRSPNYYVILKKNDYNAFTWTCLILSSPIEVLSQLEGS